MALLNYEGKEYELKQKSLSIVRKEDLMYKQTTLEDTYRKQFDYVLACLGSEQTEEILGSTVLNDSVDLIELTYICNAIDSAYNEKLNQQQIETAERALSSKAFDKVIKLGNSTENLAKLAKK